MNNSISINKKQLTLLLTNLLIVKMIFTFPRFMFKTSGNSAWIEAIYVSLIAYALLEISLSLYKFSGNRSIIQLSESIGKMPLKIIVSIIAAIILAANVGTEIRTYAESVKIILLPKSNTEYILILFTIAVSLGSYFGLGALAAINALFLPFCLFFIAVLITMLVGYYDINNLFPIFGTGFDRIFIGGLKDLSCFSDILALNLLLPHCRDIEMAKISGRRAVLLGGIVITLLCLAYGMTYTYPVSTEFLLTSYQLSRMIRAGEYFQRFEALFEFVWSITHLIYSSIYIYLIYDVLASAFKLQYPRTIIPCISAVIVILSFEPSSIVDLLTVSGTLKAYTAPAAYLLPIIIPLIYALYSKRKKKSAGGNL